jgi:hypothetical protein
MRAEWGIGGWFELIGIDETARGGVRGVRGEQRGDGSGEDGKAEGMFWPHKSIIGKLSRPLRTPQELF